MQERRIRVLKWAVAIAAALLFDLLAVDWCVPGDELHLAAAWLGLTGDSTWQFPLWGWLVRTVGKDVRLLGLVSANAAFLCLVLLLATVDKLVQLAVASPQQSGKDGSAGVGHCAFISVATCVLSAFAFALTPGFLRAATRISPVMVSLVPPLAALALAIHALSAPGGCVWKRLKRHWWATVLALALAAYTTFEIFLAPQTLLTLALPPLTAYLAVGAIPMLVILWRIRRRRLVHFKSLSLTYGGWSLVLGAMAVVSIMTFEYGRTAHRVLSRIAFAARDFQAVEADGQMVDALLFALRGDARVADVDDVRDPANESERKVLTAARYFPTHVAWREACNLLVEIPADDPQDGFVRRLLARSGNGLGCELLAKGDKTGAAEVFWTIYDKIDRNNYSALVNLTEMARCGDALPQAMQDVVCACRKSVEARMKSREDLETALRNGGPVCSESTSPVRPATFVVKGDADCAPVGTWMTAVLPVDALLWSFPALVFVLATLWRKGPTVFASQPQQEPHRHFATDKDYWESLGVSTGVVGAKPAAETPHRDPAMTARPVMGRAKTEARPDAHGVLASDKRGQRRKEHELLSEAAFVAGHFVEAYFWAFKAKMEGSQAMTRTMAKCCSAWMRNGRHSERENVTERFTANRGSFARAALRIQCGMDVQASRKRIKALAKDGLREAKQYLENMER